MLVKRQVTGACLLIILLWISNTSCRAYRVQKSELEKTLRTGNCSTGKGYKLNSLRMIQNGKILNNSLDTMSCRHSTTGKRKLKKFKYDSKISIVTSRKKTIRFYAKTLYIWNDEFLIGERTAPTLRGINLYPVRLSDIEEIVVR
jgi:hypothetical protein